MTFLKSRGYTQFEKEEYAVWYDVLEMMDLYIGEEKSMKIKIKLLSDLCTASGETHNSLIDLDVVYDKYGLPYIPAKRLKGCIREAALEMQELGLVTETQFGQMFGQSGSQKVHFVFQMLI